MKEQLDRDTLLAFTEGVESGFNKVFETFYQEICRFTTKLISNRAEAQDITAETFVKLYKLHDRFATEANIRAFLYITARNNALNYLNYAHTRKTYYKDFTESIADLLLVDIDDNPSQRALIEVGLIKEIYQAIEELPDRSKLVIKMSYFQGLDAEAIAHQLSITSATVRSQKRYALHLLRLRFADNQMALAFICSLSIVECRIFHDFSQVLA
jgi:RNA polymerase sigma-70 factor (ECF subfamily)